MPASFADGGRLLAKPCEGTCQETPGQLGRICKQGDHPHYQGGQPLGILPHISVFSDDRARQSTVCQRIRLRGLLRRIYFKRVLSRAITGEHGALRVFCILGDHAQKTGGPDSPRALCLAGGRHLVDRAPDQFCDSRFISHLLCHDASGDGYLRRKLDFQKNGALGRHCIPSDAYFPLSVQLHAPRANGGRGQLFGAVDRFFPTAGDQRQCHTP